MKDAPPVHQDGVPPWGGGGGGCARCRLPIGVRKRSVFHTQAESNPSLQYGAVPIIVPRTEPTRQQLDAYLAGGIDGVLVMEGSDLGSEYNPYGDMGNLPKQVAEEVRAKHAGDVEIDEAKDSLEMRLIKEKVLAEGVPYLGLCRGSQMLNVALGGTLYFDVCAETRCVCGLVQV